ncbi:SAM-dependent methyltransferase [Pseudonocardia sp. GCM10023141]|uniref:SAM-dependent methyltransferase n=1 Tax=Pseudonocardia sp. GCM10023141 TaxID=3252653 RepID=UPI0036203E37
MTDEQIPDIRSDVPHGARIWNYWLGGKDNYAADRAVGDAVLAAFPQTKAYAVESRRFLVRAVRHLAGEAGIRQFLDIGTGLPTMQNTHEVAQGIAPESRIVYVDNDPLVLAHARALLVNTTPEGVTTYIDADYRDPAKIIAGARDVLDFTQPIAVLFMGVFGYLKEAADARAVIAGIMDVVPSGSYMVLWDGTDTSEAVIAASKAQAEMGSPYELRTVAEIEGWFAGFEPVEPGIVTVTRWRPSLAPVGGEVVPIDAYGGVARKP